MANNKIIYFGEVLMDLTGDTVTANKILTGFTAHDKSGEIITGTCDFDSNTEDATITVAEMLDGKTAYARGSKLVGTMPNKGAVIGTISTKDGTYTIPMGFHDGSGSVGIDGTEQEKLIPGNIKSGVTILGVEGAYGGGTVQAQSKTVSPGKIAMTVLPDEGYDYLSQVIVNAIAYTTSTNAAGGTTVTIGA